MPIRFTLPIFNESVSVSIAQIPISEIIFVNFFKSSILDIVLNFISVFFDKN